jgi:site-specific recombinase XerD
MYKGSADAIIVRRCDILRVHDYARQNCDLRDYMLIRLPLKVGLRTGEECSLCVEDIDFRNHSFNVTDSKSKRAYPLPLDPVSLQLIQDLVGQRLTGYVFTQKSSWRHAREGKRLTDSTVWIRVKRIAEAAGVQHFNPRLLRHFFAADWNLQGKNIEVLRRILRHKSLAYTQFYLARLVFWEDVQREYQSIQDGPFVGGVKPLPLQMQSAEPMLSSFYQEWCVTCGHAQLCKLIDQTPAWATGCHFYVVKEEKASAK